MTETQPDHLVASVRAVLPSLTPSAQVIARLILDDPATVARSTITELSANSGVSEATIVRTARMLGFSGYAPLRLALAAAAARAEPDRLVPGDLGLTDPLSDVIAKVTRSEIEALSDTAAQLNPDQLDTVISAAIAARRIDIYGVSASGLVAADMAQKLLRIGMSGHAFTDVHLALTSAALLRKGDLAIGISTSGETPDIIEPLRQAGLAGATTVAITNNPWSNLARTADHTLVSAGRETSFRPGAMASRISQLLLVDCLFVGITQRTFATSEQALKLTREAVSDYMAEHRPRPRS
ncbi:MurR/RpiR family transcriptional regulator [Catellatospora sp. KI3]|uniref:MurR/RpiR family transcriptional regulator n=1 Tax=Catellatospora sp. KI3 TaxID=3041620 RepID=UPI0024826A26|nr:MurR/RpiR family transcriptional regulator [Catellatospora sp. KI3]MDI1463109.1 MurR/RpiR family transcriptional regulator [Catellatospora sp. KI3]